MSGGAADSRLAAFFSRHSPAPTPTGSSTTGLPERFDCSRQMRAAAYFSREGVPRFSTVASAMRVISSISSGASAIMGLAPQASRRFAQSLAVTIFDMQCTSGRFSRTPAQTV